jgi:hypothetical protein
MGMSTPPGWYDDGTTPNAQRWFDGASWTQHLRPVDPQWAARQTVAQPWAAPQPSTGPDDALHWILPVGRSWQSITAGYLGLFGLAIWPLAPIAIWLGIWALRRASQGGHGRGRAIFAIIAGALGTVFGALALIFWV